MRGATEFDGIINDSRRRHTKNEITRSNWQRISKDELGEERNEKFWFVVYVQLTIVCYYSATEIKSRTLSLDGWARARRAGVMK